MDGLLNLLEWFTEKRGLEKGLYEGKIGHLSKVMLTLIPPSVIGVLTTMQLADVNHCANTATLASMHPMLLDDGDSINADGSDECIPNPQVPASDPP